MCRSRNKSKVRKSLKIIIGVLVIVGIGIEAYNLVGVLMPSIKTGLGTCVAVASGAFVSFVMAS